MFEVMTFGIQMFGETTFGNSMFEVMTFGIQMHGMRHSVIKCLE